MERLKIWLKNIFMAIVNMFVVLWQLPQTMVGFLYLIWVVQRIAHIERYKTSVVVFVKNSVVAFSVGHLIFVPDDFYEQPLNSTLIKHEYGHSMQSIMLGWLYIPVVAIPSMILVMLSFIFPSIAKKYYTYFPERWADSLMHIKRNITT